MADNPIEVYVFDPPEFVPNHVYNTGDLFKGVPYSTPEAGDIYEVEQDNVSGEFGDVEPFCANRGGFAVGGLTGY